MVYAFSPVGAFGHVVRVEVDIGRGLPGTEIVGLARSEVREARDRVRIAIRNSGFEYPDRRVLISLSPAEIPKIGAGFDLPIALALLGASGQIDLGFDLLAQGELSIHGHVVPARGALSAALAAEDVAIPAFVSAPDVGSELVGCAIQWIPVPQLTAVGRPLSPSPIRAEAPHRRSSATFDDMSGQNHVKWACAAAAAGGHNLMLAGPPGSGKTMAATRLAGLLPDQTDEDARTSRRLFSMRGVPRRADRRPPVRMPHHGATMEGLLGGGSARLPGEISLAHGGVLILDEAAEFRPRALQALREPLEQATVTVSRASHSDTYPARFQLVLTTNLCPCGRLGAAGCVCVCSARDVARYWRRLGEALLDRVDIRVFTAWSHGDGSELLPDVTDRTLRAACAAATARQRFRYRADRWTTNARVPDFAIEVAIPLSRRAASALRSHADTRSDRAIARIRRLARTLADLDDVESVDEDHINRAVALRSTVAVGS